MAVGLRFVSYITDTEADSSSERTPPFTLSLRGIPTRTLYKWGRYVWQGGGQGQNRAIERAQLSCRKRCRNVQQASVVWSTRGTCWTEEQVQAVPQTRSGEDQTWVPQPLVGGHWRREEEG